MKKRIEKVVVVTGATGQVGWGIAHSVLEEGGSLILSTRTEDGAEAIVKEFGKANVHPVIADLTSERGAGKITEKGRELGSIDHVAAPIGSWWQKGASLDQDIGELNSLLKTYVTAQINLLKATADDLRKSQGSYTLVTGAAGEHFIRGSGLLVTAVKAQYGLSEVLRRELKDEPFRLNEVRIDTRIERDPRPGVVPSKEAGAFFVDLMNGHQNSSLIRYSG